jgi:hypothetical protein
LDSGRNNGSSNSGSFVDLNTSNRQTTTTTKTVVVVNVDDVKFIEDYY